MKHKLLILVILFAIIFILYLLGVYGGFYSDGIYLDEIQHFLAGGMFGVFWLWLLDDRLKMAAPTGFILIATILGFSALAAVIWEFFEFALWRLVPVFATSYELYSPTIADLLGDILFSLVGAFLIGAYQLIKKKYAQ